MGWPQIVSGSALVVLLLGLSLGFAQRQMRNLRRLRGRDDLGIEEEQFERSKARRRLVGCALTLLMAVVLAGVLIFLEGPAQRLADAQAALPVEERGLEDHPEKKLFMRFYAGTWIVFLLLLLGLLGVALADLLATRRYALKQHRKIQADRRAMIQRQVNRMRQERNGPG